MDKKMKNRIEMVRAMECVARSINDEDIFESWLMCGVADEDIREDTVDEDLEYYVEDENFKELMDLFLRLMVRASKSGGLYCGGVVTEAG